MKLSVLLTCILSVNLMASVYSQNARFDLDIKDQTVRDVLKTIEKESQFRFFYNDEFNDLDKKLTFSITGQSIDGLLSLVLNDTEVSYKILDNNFIVITPKTLLQQIKITGTITDENGNPFPGVNVLIKGTTIGTTSDVNGKYSLDVPDKNVVLVITFLGYSTQRVSVAGKTTVDVSMTLDIMNLAGVVVVGYGTQKKMDITGAVSSIKSDALESRNVTSGSLALVGEMSGVSVRQLSGNPRSNNAEIRIRGLGTFSSAGNNPLILVDGIESSIDNIDPNDINSVSVLKDAASSSIFGSKAANGVILVETKKGIAGAPKFSFYSYVGKQKASMMPQMVHSWDYATGVNEALVNAGQSKRYTDDDIQKFKSGTDPAYPDFNHLKYLWTSGSGIQTKTGISMSGGTPGTQYLFSAGYLDQGGLVMKNFTKRYDIRLNLNTKLKDNINLNVNLSGNYYNGKEPSGAYAEQGIAYLTRGAMRLTNVIPMHTADGYWGRNETLHPEADLNSPSFLENKNSYLYGNTELAWNIFKDLKISGKVGYTYSFAQNKTFIATYPVTANYSVTPNTLSVNWSSSIALTVQSLIEYNKSFGDHSIHLLGGFSQQQYTNSSLSAFRDAFPNNEIYEIDAGTTTRGTQGGNASENKLRSFFGRGNYSYLDKYLLEANIRYDGSSRFPKAGRYGLFPSVSAGWRVSKESFFQNVVPWINDLKIRGSWGELGNQSVGDYPYQDLISFGENYPFGTSFASGAAILTVPNKNITWETTRITDVGLDVSVMDKKLALTADYFVKTTSDILYSITVSPWVGATPSPSNAGKVENKGWDFDLSYRNTLGDFSYSVSPNLSLVNNKVVNLANIKLDIAKGLFIGYPIGSTYGYVADGIFVDQADCDNWPTQPYKKAPGEIRLKDISGPGGIPDGKVDATYDRTIINGSPLPTSTYGLNMTANYKGFELALLFQGEGGRKASTGGTYYGQALSGDGNIQQWQFDQRWTAENPNPNAGYPRMYFDSPSYAASTFWIKNATFIRLKNVQIGYNLPSGFSHKLSMSNVRFYISGENLFTITNFYLGWDPEMQINQTGWYPLTKLWMVGINVNF